MYESTQYEQVVVHLWDMFTLVSIYCIKPFFLIAGVSKIDDGSGKRQDENIPRWS